MTGARKSEFQQVENQQRVDAMRKDEAREQALREINRALSGLESADTPAADPPSAAFIFGLPRSGTTLCYQLLAQCLDVGYINNLIARFWAAPAHGVALSEHLRAGSSSQPGDYESLYGKTTGIWGPHEFSYFWHETLNITDAEEITTFGRSERVDWPEARRRVALITEAFGRPTVFKTMYAGEFAPQFSEWMPSPLFIHVRRELEDVALSLLQARIDYYGDPAAWWSMYPPDYRELAELDFAAQIAGQVVGLDDAYSGAAAALDPARLITVDYGTLASNPEAFLRTVVDRLHELSGVRVPITAEPPHLQERRRTAQSEDERAVLAALAARLSER